MTDMNAVAADVFTRFVAAVPTDGEASLAIDAVQSPDASAVAKHPYWTVVFHGRHEGKVAPHALVLVTVPSRAADAPEVLEFAVRRARAQKVPYFITWTLRDAVLWRTPKPGVAVARDALEKLRDYTDLYEVGAGDSGPLTEPVRLRVLERGRELLHDLERLLKDEALELVQIDATYFVGRLLEAAERLLPIVAGSIHDRLQADVMFRQEVGNWGLRQSIAGSATDPEFARSVARQIIYRLLGKVLFYQSLRRTARQLPRLALDALDSSQVLPTLRASFALALQIDYHAVFDEDVPDRITWPGDASRELATFVHDLQTRDFASLPQDVIGTVFERLIPPEERHALGQYFTGENLCDLIAAFCVRSPTDMVLDPTCGTGTFLIRSYDRLRWLGRHSHGDLLSQLWGVDVAPFPAELATINLFRQKIGDHDNFPRIICRDIFSLAPGDRFPFPPPKMNVDFQDMEDLAGMVESMRADVDKFGGWR